MMAAQQPYSLEPKYRRDIDGLRAIAVLAVVAFHAFPSSISGGFIGVDIFFVISGYLISTIIFEKLDRESFSFLEFYGRRIKRIFPALLLVLMTCFAFGWHELLSDEFEQLGKHIAAGSVFSSNLVLWSESGYFDTLSESKPLLHLWSLGIEEQFYILWPLLLWLAWKIKFNRLMVILIVALISLALNILGVEQDPVAVFYSPQTRFWELLSGSFLAWLTLYKKSDSALTASSLTGLNSSVTYKSKRKIETQTFGNGVSILGCFLLAYGFWNFDKNMLFPGFLALVPVLGSIFIIAAGPTSWINSKFLSSNIAVWFGLISFPLYLWHWPILSFARIIENDLPSIILRVGAVTLSILLAWITYKLVEQPLRSSKPNKKNISILVTLMVIVGFIGYNAYTRNGLPFRLKGVKNENLLIKRKGVESSLLPLGWYEGKNDWLFLGDKFNKTVSKLKLSITPTNSETNNTREVFSALAKSANAYNAKVVLFIGPSKSAIYSEFLPDNITPSKKKYTGFFLDKLSGIPNLAIYDPTENLLSAKKSEGLLYWMTDTHWNHKGAFVAFSGLSKLLGLPPPDVIFSRELTPHVGDLVAISRLSQHPLHAEDNWNVAWKREPILKEEVIPNEQKTSFGVATVVTNQVPLSSMNVWVVGDSFSVNLRPYFNATFGEVRYVGHWSEKLESLASELAKSAKKPDVIVVVKAERSF